MFSAFETLTPLGQFFHVAHFALCALALICAALPLLTEKGSEAHKFGGFVYLIISLMALVLGSLLAWQEASAVLFCFNSFCAYLLLSGWRAVHEEDAPAVIDWFIPGGLFVLALSIMLHAVIYDEGKKSFYLGFFALNAFYLAWRDGRQLLWRQRWQRHKIFFGPVSFGKDQSAGWIGRHASGMIGSVMANASVIALTLLPLWLHWVWPVGLLLLALVVAMRQRERRRGVAAVIEQALKRPSHSNP